MGQAACRSVRVERDAGRVDPDDTLVPGLPAALWTQGRQPAARPTPGTALPAGLRLAQWVLGGLMAVMGAALFVAPGIAEQLWPWSLTPLTARMVGSFYLAIGVSLFAAAHEND